MSCSDYANGLVCDAKTRSLDKLKLLNSECPYSIPKSMWKHGLDCSQLFPKFLPQTYSSIWAKPKIIKTTLRPLVHTRAFLLKHNRLLEMARSESSWQLLSQPKLY
ncbi:Uncharacterized protein APZ42_030047 [Daphnia magna]|uniref:Uncharacterized protein n=1 Tax=Daphnia magna TaxID=35525 RepID=A0A164P3P4_9CRUS|nr:Uncharacterized protein APZ42_030047 [Daphnia magna]